MADSVESIENAPEGVAPEMPNFASGRLGGQDVKAVNPGMVNGQQRAPDIRSLYQQLYSNASLGVDGTKYVEDLKKIINEQSKKFGIELVQLTYPAGTLAAVMGNNAIVLIFDEAIRQDAKLPTANQTKAALESLQNQFNNEVTMNECVIVHPSDYPKVQAMGAWLINTLLCIKDPELSALNVHSFNDTSLEISLNRNDYVNFQEIYNPHGILDRADLTITVYTANRRREQKNQLTSFWREAETDRSPLATIGAYVTFSQQLNDRGEMSFLPEIHISQMTAKAPTFRIVPLLLSIATDILVDRGHWKQQFSDFRADGPNIGNLMKDDKGQPYKAQKLYDRDIVLTKVCHPFPALLLDVVEGRARIPGVEQFALSPEQGGWANILENYNKFLGNPVLDTNTICPAIHQYRDFVGLFLDVSRTTNTYKDSRYLDFLNAMVHHSNNPALCAKLLEHHARGEDSIQTVFEFIPADKLKVLYVNHVVSLEATPLRAIQNVVHNSIRTIDNQIAAGIVDIGSMINAAKGFQSPAQGYYQGGGTTPFGTIYGTAGSGGMQQNLHW